jgi:protein bicaudal D
LVKFQTSQLESTQAGIEAEESLLHETAARESSLNTQVLNMEIDLKNVKVSNITVPLSQCSQAFNFNA